MERFWVRKFMNSKKKTKPFSSGIVKVELFSMLSRVHFIHFFSFQSETKGNWNMIRVGFRLPHTNIRKDFFAFASLSSDYLLLFKYKHFRFVLLRPRLLYVTLI